MSVRVETVAIGGYYCAVFRRPGQPDEFLVDAAGRPQRFASVSVALRQGRKALVVVDKPKIEAVDEDVLGMRAWRAAKDADQAAERERVFGPAGTATLERNGRTVVIERRRRR